MKRLAFYALVVGATIATLIVFWQFRSILILLFLSLILSSTLRPSVDYLSKRGLRPGLARLLVYLALFGIIGVTVSLIIGPLLEELQLLSNYLVVAYDSTYNAWSMSSGWQQSLAARLPAPDQFTEALSGPVGDSLRQVVFGVSQSTLTVLAGLVIVIALSLYWSSDRSHFERLWLSLLPAERRIQARTIWQSTDEAIGAYVRSEVVQAFLAFVLLTAGYSLVGLDYPILAGILAGLSWLIPVVGFVFAAAVAFLFGLLSVGGLTAAIAALVVTILVLAFLEFVVEPRLFRRQDFSGVLFVLVIVAMVDAYGLIGFVIAPPLAVAIQVLFGHVIGAFRQQPFVALQIESLQEQAAEVKALYATRGETDDDKASMPHEIGSLLTRLDALLSEAREISNVELVARSGTVTDD